MTTVPAGKLLVIEQVTAGCTLGAGQRLIMLQLKVVLFGSSPFTPANRHHLVSSFNGGIGSFDFFASSQHVRFVPAGASVYLSAQKRP